MKNSTENYDRLLVLTDLGTVRVLSFKQAGDDPKDLAHLIELSENDLASPRGAETTDNPGKFARGSAATDGQALSHAETKLDVEIEKRAIGQVAQEIGDIVSNSGCSKFILAAPQEHLKRMEAELDSDSGSKLEELVGADLTNVSLKDLEKRFL